MARIHPITAAALGLSGCVLLASPLLAQRVTLSPNARFHAAQPVQQSVVHADVRLQKLNLENRSAISVTAGNFFEDGANALVTGYALGNVGMISLQRGSELPQESELATKSAFSAQTSMIDLGLRPDLLKSADLSGHGHQDLVAATLGGSTIQVLTGDGRGNFAAQAPIAVNGKIASLATWHSNTGPHVIVAGVCAKTCSLNLIDGDGSLRASLPMPDRIGMIATARLNGTGTEDIVAGGASRLVIFDGKSLGTPAARVDTLPISGAVAVATGVFVYDRRMLPQVAVLTADGTIHTFARAGLIAQPPTPPSLQERIQQRIDLHRHKLPAPSLVDPASLSWTEVETLSAVATPPTSSIPSLIRTRISGSGMDDLVVMNANGGETVTVRHPVVNYPPDSDSPYAGTVRALAAVVETEPSLAGQTVAAIPLRVSQDARLGFVSVDGSARPKHAALTAYHTYTVNQMADGAVVTGNCPGSNCTLRDAIHAADNEASTLESNGKADTINVPAGTYVLGNHEPSDDYGDVEYHVEIYAPVNIIGAGSGSTFITTSNKDHIFSENSANANAENNSETPMDFYMSGVQLENGTNTNASSGDINGGLMDMDTAGTGYITLQSCIFTSGYNANGPGGGLFVSDNLINEENNTVPYGPGVFELDSSTVSNNTTVEDGGGVYSFGEVPFLINGDTFTSNKVNGGIGSDGNGSGSGGAIYFATLAYEYCSGNPGDYTPQLCSQTRPAAESLIENSTFTGNSGIPNYANTNTSSDGGAVFAADGLDITGSVFTGNSTGEWGGAIYITPNDAAPSIIGNVITGNSAGAGHNYGDGGGIYATAESGTGTVEPLTVNYNTIFGNSFTQSGGFSGLSVRANDTLPSSTTAKYNFWGCNTGANGYGCDTAGGAETIALTPYAVVSAALTPNGSGSYPYNSTITLTGGITTDSTGASLGSANEAGFNGLATSQSIVVGSTTIASGTPTTGTGGTASIMGTLTASGHGTATFTIHNATVQPIFTAQPAPPVANNQNLNTAYATPLNITLTASGSGTLTYTVASNPAHGSLSGSAPNLTYTPNSGFVGSDSFTFYANNGANSNTATIAISVNPIIPEISLNAPASANRGTPSALTATLTVPSGAPAPTAQANFYADGTTLLGSASFTGSGTTYTATYNAADIPGGPRSLTASYPGDSAYSAVTSDGKPIVVTQNNLWIGNGDNTTTAYDPIGSPYLSNPETSGGAGGVAIDPSGNVWSTQGTQLAEYSNTGSVLSTSYGGGELNNAYGIAIDGSGIVWVANKGNSTVAAFQTNGNPVAGTAYAGAYLSTPTGIAVDISGDLWISNQTGTVTELLGAATPTVPLAPAITNNTPAAKP